MAVVFAPSDDERAARQINPRFAAGEAAPRRGDQSRAGGRAAGERRADAALPDPQPDVVGSDDLGERHVDLLGKQRMRLEARPQCFNRRVGDVGDEKHDDADCPC